MESKISEANSDIKILMDKIEKIQVIICVLRKPDS